MKKQSLFTVALVVLMSMIGAKSFAHDIAVVNADGVTIYYVWTNNNTELSVSYRGSYYSEYNEYSGNVVIPSSVEYQDNTYNVTSIGGSAFDSCSGLTSVTIPSSVTSIGGYAFNSCSGLTSVTIPSSVTSIGGYAFYFCSGLTSVTIPSSVTSIGGYAFYYCSGLTSLTLMSSQASIPYDAFYGCGNLKNVTFDCEEVTSIFSESSSIEVITLSNKVKTIANKAFYKCSGLTSVTIPNSVTSIGVNAFYGTPWYNSQPDGLVYAGNVAYKYKGTMPDNTSVSIKEGTLGITESAFKNQSGLTSVTIPNSVTSIGGSAFSGCSNLKTIWSEIEAPFAIATDVFSSYTTSRLIVPVGTTADYL